MTESQTSLQPTYPIPISNGILAHCQSIGPAIWVFLWLIDHTTKESEGADGQLEGLVFGGLQVRSSQIAKDLGIATRTVHEHVERLCGKSYVRRIDNGEGFPSGYAVQKSKKWRRNQALLAASVQEEADPAETRAPSQESANPRVNPVGVRGNPRYPRGNPLPIRRTVQDNTKQETQSTSEGLDSFALKATKAKTPSGKHGAEEIDRVYQAYPLKKAPAKARLAIGKALDRLVARGEVDPVAFLIGAIGEWKAARERDAAAGRFVPHFAYPATWFNGECYDEESLHPVKNCALPSGELVTAAELHAQTGWQVMRGVA